MWTSPECSAIKWFHSPHESTSALKSVKRISHPPDSETGATGDSTKWTFLFTNITANQNRSHDFKFRLLSVFLRFDTFQSGQSAIRVVHPNTWEFLVAETFQKHDHCTRAFTNPRFELFILMFSQREFHLYSLLHLVKLRLK